MKKVMLIIRDWRWYRKETENNAIAQVDTPFTDNLMKNYPNILLNTSGEDVWLPAWYQWNSEVWHMTIGSGRIMFQSLERINHSIKDW
jgi:2,3-bisphosphoglycerate-independent phosphoglycerate mutase